MSKKKKKAVYLFLHILQVLRAACLVARNEFPVTTESEFECKLVSGIDSGIVAGAPEGTITIEMSNRGLASKFFYFIFSDLV